MLSHCTWFLIMINHCQTTLRKDFDRRVHFKLLHMYDCWHVCVKMPTSAQTFGRSHASVCHNLWKCFLSVVNDHNVSFFISLCFFFLKILRWKAVMNLSDQHFLSSVVSWKGGFGKRIYGDKCRRLGSHDRKMTVLISKKWKLHLI